jgi:hypothetical protein
MDPRNPTGTLTPPEVAPSLAAAEGPAAVDEEALQIERVVDAAVEVVAGVAEVVDADE